ncbi:MAG: PVC-type heme-binding CxxCH protein [Pirellulales bacterium]
MNLLTRLHSFIALLIITQLVMAADGNRLVYLDAPCNPYYAHRKFPKLVTSQWVGEKGVEAVVTLGIDDMRDVDKYEAYLRPLLNRLKTIDGRAPVSIMTCQVDPDNPHLQTWLKEGLSLETHTSDHPCPCLQKSQFDQAKRTYDTCVDQLSAIPGSKPVAFRFPCCDSKNTPSPRAFAEILNQTTAQGAFTQISSSVAVILTANDPDLPRDLVIDSDGSPKFSKYIPFPSFVNKVENYPYPFVIGRLCWEFPIAVPDDWQGNNLHQPKNPKTVDDMKAVIDATLIKQGIANIVFHPHNWIRNDQMIEVVDHVEKKHGNKVKFLTFGECLDRMNSHMLAGQPLRASNGQDNGVRILDLNNDGFLDVIIGNEHTRLTRVWNPTQKKWIDSVFPVAVVQVDKQGNRRDAGVRFGILTNDGNASFLMSNESVAGGWHFDGSKWIEDRSLLTGLSIGMTSVTTSKAGLDQGMRLRDIDGDGICELIVSNPTAQATFTRDRKHNRWNPLKFNLPTDTTIVDSQGRDAGLRFVDVNEDGHDDVLFSNDNHWSLHLYESLQTGWSDKISGGQRNDQGAIPLIVRNGLNNGVWFANRHLWIQNEDTARLPDGVDRRSFNDLLGDRPARPKSTDASLQGIKVPEGFEVKLVAAEPLIQDPVAFDWGPDGRLWVVEMADYPLGINGKQEPGGRVRTLEDTDGDGVYDQSTLFLDGLSTPTGILVWRKGVLITAAPDVIYAEDTDGDGQADVRKSLFTGFGKGNQQHRVNGLRWGLDNWVYLANGDSGGNITSDKTGSKTDIRGLDVRIRPDTGLIDAQSGQTQFGRNRDDWGNWFGCNNPNPIFQYLLSDHYLKRNPFFAPPNPRVDIREGSELVYPISRVISHCDTRYRPLNAPTKFTSACSTIVYRDQIFGPQFSNNTFTSEPVYNLIHRRVLIPQGARFTSRRLPSEENSEFFRSNDPWCRPTSVQVGPDGAIYVADMYRQVIEHPEWINDELEKVIDVRAGQDRGRIYRIAPVGVSLRQSPGLDQLDVVSLVAALDTPGGWQRDLVQRMLIWKNDPAAIIPLQSLARHSSQPLTRLHALCTLDGLSALQPALIITALTDEHPGVRKQAIRLAEPLLRNIGKKSTPLTQAVATLVDDNTPLVRMQLAYSLGEWKSSKSTHILARLALTEPVDKYLTAAILSSVSPDNLSEFQAAVGAWQDQPKITSAWQSRLANLEKGFANWHDNQKTVLVTRSAPIKANSNRQPIVDKFQDAIALKGDVSLGKSLFKKNCSACHLLEGIGHQVGPDLTALTNRAPEAMLIAILDPNRAVEEKYRSYQVATDKGKVISGTIKTQTSTSITIVAEEGKTHVLLRNEIEELVASGKSMMPEGVEKLLSVQDMANLLGYLSQAQSARPQQTPKKSTP